jgi:lipoprotein-releasing system ATP-binding protein
MSDSIRSQESIVGAGAARQAPPGAAQQTPAAVVVACKGLRKIYMQGRVEVPVLSDVNLQILAGERVAIVGASGSGKSTLLHLLGGLDSATAGEISIQGQDIGRLSAVTLGELRNRALGFVYQFHHLLPEFTAVENVVMPLLIRRMPAEAAYAQATDVLERVGLGHRLGHKPGELSGGERQRAAVARALVTRPACVLADEPTGNLDRRTAGAVFDLMLQLNSAFQTSLVVVTHDEELARRMQRVLRLADGQLSSY